MNLPALTAVVAATLLGPCLAASRALAQSPATSPRDSAAAARRQSATDTTDTLDAQGKRRTRKPPHTLAPVQVLAHSRGGAGYASTGALASTKTGTPLHDVPQAATVVTQQLMRDQSMQGMADVVRYIPGITIGQGEGNRDQVTIRGNASSADFFVDGMRDDAQYYRDLYNLDRVEALKGSNALLFGRGGGGGVLNRVTKQPQWTPIREVTVAGGSFGDRRASLDFGQGIASSVAARLNAVYEHSGLYRDGVTLTRYGINPTLTFAPGSGNTTVTLGYEHFSDHRTADRGIPSFEGLPLATGVSTFFGNPDINYADARVNTADAVISHETAGGMHIRNHTRFTAYSKIYQNVFPGAVNGAGDEVTLSAYNHSTPRRNLFNQTDVTYDLATGTVRHTLLAGAELGRQSSDNFRNTGYFENARTSIVVPVADPTVFTPVTFRQSATDADAHVTATTRSLYVQDHASLSARWQVIAGVRYDHFGIRYHDNRSNATRSRDDDMVSQRFGVVFKPVEPVSVYASQSVSWLPSAGDQFSSLTATTQGLDPERFTNYEVGVKWAASGRLALTMALYQLDRTNTRAPDPADPTLMVQTGRQRTTGFELGASGNVTTNWAIVGGYSRQDATITSTTAAAATGARVALVPRRTLSLWNKYQVARALGFGLGITNRSAMFAAVDDKVSLPGYTEVDAALYATVAGNVRAQLYLENLFNIRYFQSAHGNNNITPGSPRAVRISVTTGF